MFTEGEAGAVGKHHADCTIAMGLDDVTLEERIAVTWPWSVSIVPVGCAPVTSPAAAY